MSGSRTAPLARFIPLVVLLAAALGAASSVILYLGDLPRTENVSPARLRDVLVLLLLVTAVAAPLATLLVPRWRRRPSLALAGVCAIAALVHSAALSELTRVTGQDATSAMALVVLALLVLWCLVSVGEERREIPVRSSWSE